MKHLWLMLRHLNASPLKRYSSVLIEDAFTDTNGTSLDAHVIAPTNPLGLSWVEQVNNWSISSNKAVEVTGVSRCIATVNVAKANCTITVKANSRASGAPTTNDCGIAARYTNTNNYWQIGINDNVNIFRIVERNAATETSRASVAKTITGGTEYTLVAVLNGTTITATIDGADEISYGSAALNQSTTVHGMKAYMDSPTDTLDNFKIEE